MQSLKGIGAFAGATASGSVLVWPDTVLVGMAGMNELHLATWEGEALDTIRPPSVRRRGVPENAQVKFETDMSMSFKDRVEMMSLLAGIYRLRDGETVLVHYDQTVTGEIPMVEWLAAIYLTVLSADRRTACVDGFVPYTNETRARLAVSRDTLSLSHSPSRPFRPAGVGASRQCQYVRRLVRGIGGGAGSPPGHS